MFVYRLSAFFHPFTLSPNRASVHALRLPAKPEQNEVNVGLTTQNAIG